MKVLFHENSLSAQLESLEGFVTRREKYKNRRYNAILYLALTCIIIGAVFTLTMFYVGGTVKVNRIIYNYSDSGFLNILGHIGIFLGSVGLTIMSLIPPRSMKIDKVLQQPMIICLTSIVTIGSGFILGCHPPYIGFVLCLSGIGVTGISLLKSNDTNGRHKYDITLALCMWLALFLNVLWPIFFYMGANPSTFFSSRLLYHDKTVSHEYLRTIGYLLGSYYLFMCIVVGAFLSFELYQQFYYDEYCIERSAQLLVYCLYSFISVIGLSCIVGGVTTISIGTGTLKFGGLVATINGIVMLLPIVLVVIVGRGNLFCYLEKVFDKIDHIDDGAFIAEVVAGKDYSEGSVYFVKREDLDTEDKMITSGGDTFPEENSRRFFVKGKIVKKTINRLVVQIDLDEDKKTEDWNISEFVNQRNYGFGALSSNRSRPAALVPQITSSNNTVIDVENPGPIQILVTH